MSKSLAFILLAVSLLVIGIVMYDFVTNREYNVEPINFSLFDPGRVYRIAPMVKYELGDGTVITVYRRNPFEFSIVADINGSLSLPSRLTVYKIDVRRSDIEVFDMASSLGVDTDRLFYNNVTETYLFHNDTCVFEYTVRSGFIRLKLNTRSSIGNNAGFPPDNVLIDRALTFLKSHNLFYLKDYEVRVGDYYKVGNKVLIKAVVFRAKLDGIRVGNLGLTVLVGPKGNVIGVEGIMPLSIEKVGEYPVKSLSELLGELRKKIANGDPMTDWYISWLAFTKLIINDIRVQYHVAAGNYIVPVFVFDGEYELDYENIHDKGEVHGVLLAVKSP